MNRIIHLITEHARGEEGERPTGAERPRTACALYALLGVLAVGCWQAATVHFNFGGNWTALFCTGDARKVPPELAASTYIFKSSTGYDGQFYRYIAHDLWLQKGWWKYQDAPQLRYGRILVPALAWLLAAGQPRYIDAAYVLVVLLSVFLGIYWLGRYAAFHGRSPAWGLGFLLIPATLISIDRLTVDATLMALCAGFVWYVKRDSPVRLYVVLVLAGLTRETGLLLTGACSIYAFWNHRWRIALLLATATLPAFAWYTFVAAEVVPGGVRYSVVVPEWLFQFPLVGVAMKLFQPEPYPFAPFLTHLVQVVDAIALCGFLLALGLALWGLWRWRFDQEQWAAIAFILLTAVVSAPSFWGNVYNYARPFSPLVFLVGLRALTGGSLWLLAPIALIDLRIAAQLAPQIGQVLRGLL